MSMTISTSEGQLVIDRITVGATATLILAAAEHPRDVLVINNSAGVMDLGDATVAPGTGIPLQGSGGEFALNDKLLPGGLANTAWYAAISGGSGDLCVVRLK